MQYFFHQHLHLFINLVIFLYPAYANTLIQFVNSHTINLDISNYIIVIHYKYGNKFVYSLEHLKYYLFYRFKGVVLF